MTAPDLWSSKPWWCQPWTILLTGVAVPLVSWLLLHTLWVTAPLSFAVLVWWWLFLVLAPGAYQQDASDHE